MQSPFPSKDSESPDIIFADSTKNTTTAQTGAETRRQRHSLTPNSTTPRRPQKASARRTVDKSAFKNGTLEEPILIESPQRKVFTIEDSPEVKKNNAIVEQIQCITIESQGVNFGTNTPVQVLKMQDEANQAGSQFIEKPVMNDQATTMSGFKEESYCSKLTPEVEKPVLLPLEEKIMEETSLANVIQEEKQAVNDLIGKPSLPKSFKVQAESTEQAQNYLPSHSNGNSRSNVLEQRDSMSMGFHNIMERNMPADQFCYDSNLLDARAHTAQVNPASSPTKHPHHSHFYSTSKEAGRLSPIDDLPVEMSFNEDNEFNETERKNRLAGRIEFDEKSRSILDSDLKKRLHGAEEQTEGQGRRSDVPSFQEQMANFANLQPSTMAVERSAVKSVNKEFTKDFSTELGRQSISKEFTQDFSTELGRQSISKMASLENQFEKYPEEETGEEAEEEVPVFVPMKQNNQEGEEPKITIFFNPFENRRSSIGKESQHGSQSTRLSLEQMNNPFSSQERNSNSMQIENENVNVNQKSAVFGSEEENRISSSWEKPVGEKISSTKSSKSFLEIERKENQMEIEDPYNASNKKTTTEANPTPLRHARSPNYLEKKLHEIQEENHKAMEGVSDFASNYLPKTFDKTSADKQKPQLSKLITENLYRMQDYSTFLEEIKSQKNTPKAADNHVIKPKEGSYSAIHGMFAKSPKKPNYALPSLSACPSPIRREEPQNGKKTAGPTPSRECPGTPTPRSNNKKRKFDAFCPGEDENEFIEMKRLKQTNTDNFNSLQASRPFGEADVKTFSGLKAARSGNKYSVLSSKENIPFEINKNVANQKKELGTPQNVAKTSNVKLAKCCAFCAGAFENKSQTKTLSCLHKVHIDCFIAWERKKKASCPICNSNSSPISLKYAGAAAGTKITPTNKF